MRSTDMAAIHSDEFKRDAVRIALTSGLTRRQVASDLGIGLSTLGKWVRAVSEEAKVPAQDYAFNIAPKLLQQDFTASGPNQKWAGDITVAIVARTNGATSMATESFFKSLKAELVWRWNWQTSGEVRYTGFQTLPEVALFESIDGFCNPRRKHSALGWKSPVAFEQWAA